MNSLLQNITHALGWSMAHSLWQGALLFGALCFIYLARPNLSPKNKYAFALFAQLILFICFVVNFYHYIDVSDTSEKKPTEHAGSLLILPQKTNSSFLTPLEFLLPWLSSIYVMGLFVQLILFSNSLSKLHYLKTRGLSVVPMAWEESFQRIHSKLQIKQNSKFYLSEKISVPIVIGHLKPVILFPIAFINNLDLEHVESILIHELAHIKRRDYLFNLLKVAMETILFFNPFVWLISRYIETEREHACDDIVMRWTPSSIAYAQALMSVELLKNTSTSTYAMAAVGKKHHLLNRIQRITNMEKKYINARQHLIAVVLCSFALITIAWITPTEKPATVAEKTNIPVSSIDDPEITYQIPAPATAPPFSQDTIKLPLKPEKAPPEIAYINDVEAEAKKIEAYHNSSEWKSKIADIEEQARQTAEHFNSSEWKAKIVDIEENANRIKAYYDSSEWKNRVADIKAQAIKTEEYFNSPEWKAKIVDIEKKANEIGAYAWKSKVAGLERQAIKTEEYFNSPKWAAKVEQIDANLREIETYFSSSEWKEAIADIEANTKNLMKRSRSSQEKEK